MTTYSATKHFHGLDKKKKRAGIYSLRLKQNSTKRHRRTKSSLHNTKKQIPKCHEFGNFVVKSKHLRAKSSSISKEALVLYQALLHRYSPL